MSTPTLSLYKGRHVVAVHMPWNRSCLLVMQVGALSLICEACTAALGFLVLGCLMHLTSVMSPLTEKLNHMQSVANPPR